MVQRPKMRLGNPTEKTHPIGQPETSRAHGKPRRGIDPADEDELARDPVPPDREVVGPQDDVEVLVRFVVGDHRHQRRLETVELLERLDLRRARTGAEPGVTLRTANGCRLSRVLARPVSR